MRLCGFWRDQQDAITYQEMRELVLAGYVNEVTARLWQQDYSELVKNRMPQIWNGAMIQGAANTPLLSSLPSFTFNTQTPGVIRWIQSRGAEMVTVSTQRQKDAIALLLEDKMRNAHTVDELARLIRPCVGLYRQQAAAVTNYYEHMVKTLTEQHPRTRPERIQLKALEQSTKYAERLHRQRALMIAQTEMAFAYNYGADEGIRQAQADFLIGKCIKRWCTAGDNNVCDACKDLNGTELGMDELFYSGSRVVYEETGLYPPLHPRCGCAVQYVEIEPPPMRRIEAEPRRVEPPTEAQRPAPAIQTAEDAEPLPIVTNTPEKPASATYGSNDVTQTWLTSATPNSHPVRDLTTFVQDGVQYTVDGRNVKLDYTVYERGVAEFLESVLGGEMYMVPKVQGIYSGIQTPDFLFRGNRYDLKTPEKVQPKTFFNAIHSKRKQADNFVIDLQRCGMSDAEAVAQAERIFTDPYVTFVKRLIILRGNTVLRIIERM